MRPANVGVIAGRRYYSPGLARWVSRDPVTDLVATPTDDQPFPTGELALPGSGPVAAGSGFRQDEREGEVHLAFAFSVGDPIGRYDPFGLTSESCTIGIPGKLTCADPPWNDYPKCGGYQYDCLGDALRFWRGMGLNPRPKGDPGDADACPKGGLHYNVWHWGMPKKGKPRAERFLGTVVCCNCCSDTAGGARPGKRCSIPSKYR